MKPRGPFDRALEEILRDLVKAPNDVRLLQKAGELMQKRGDQRGAAEYFERLGQQYEADGFFLKAVALWKQVLKLDPKRSGLREKLGKLHAQLGLETEATEYLRAALAQATAVQDTASVLRLMDALAALEAEPEARE